MVYVNFRDDTESDIIASFAGPQSAEVYPFLGEVEEDDPRYIEYLSKFEAQYKVIN
ncbi:hypothetical protein [Yersinia enterocolitica]|uniref:hypothetical protein n=1 Tax=Yersinia enterocolitica TaxID=630 RepID=UPI001F59DC9D|nr:hypothetical protein [Yersinia enterocolitica]EKN3597265.1 hypothetical protein [Yersinia enterocolitica]EKN4896161.1 hypothetical protein [Yersinia enterocolitica]